MVYRFVEQQDIVLLTNLKGREFSSTFLDITPEGMITVKGTSKKGYAWNGCSPKWEIFDLALGTPDGAMDPKTFKPLTYYGSMFHDAIYQYKEVVPISRKEADLIFKAILKDCNFFWTKVYYSAVRAGGWMFGKWKKKESEKQVKIYMCSWLLKAV